MYEPLQWCRVPFDHPLWILYSSGHDGAAEGNRPRARRHPASSISR